MSPLRSNSFETAFKEVEGLVKDFKKNESHYLSPQYQERELQHDFLNKFFKILNWDVDHEHEKNPYTQEVKIEKGVEVQGAKKKADYAFFTSPNFKDVRFFVEAKKPFGDIVSQDNYFQAIRYGYNGKTPVTVLTNFKTFQVLDCRYMPHIEHVLDFCVKSYEYTDYLDPEKFSEIYFLFSRDSVSAGSLEAFSESLPKKRGKGAQYKVFSSGYQKIDKAFLEELDEFRSILASDFKIKNPQLTGDILTELTQRTIDRLVFIRFLEDKLIEQTEIISNFGKRNSAWADFLSASRKLDGIYNGIVFKKHELLDSPSFQVTDEKFKKICDKISDQNSPYDFNSIPIHILGSIYERFLGNVIVATDKRASVKEKPEVKDAGGVFYTPEYIVQYIVENTVGTSIKGKTPSQISTMKFADISCGSGSFLLGIFDCLIRHHVEFYNANPSKIKDGDCYQNDNVYFLSLRKKREILIRAYP